jgi:hypothetical protein
MTTDDRLRTALDWAERDVLRGTESPAAWGVPPDYAAGFIAGVHALRAALGAPEPAGEPAAHAWVGDHGVATGGNVPLPFSDPARDPLAAALDDAAWELVRFYGTDRTWSLAYRTLLGSRIDDLEGRLRALGASEPAGERETAYRLSSMLAEMASAGVDDPFDARDRSALARLGYVKSEAREAREAPVQSGPAEERVRVSPPLVANASLADPARDPLATAWKELIAEALRRNVVVAVGKHRPLIEAAIRDTPATPPREAGLDVERLARALQTQGWTPPSDEGVFGRYVDPADQHLSKVVAVAAAYAAAPSETRGEEERP